MRVAKRIDLNKVPCGEQTHSMAPGLGFCRRCGATDLQILQSLLCRFFTLGGADVELVRGVRGAIEWEEDDEQQQRQAT